MHLYMRYVQLTLLLAYSIVSLHVLKKDLFVGIMSDCFSCLHMYVYTYQECMIVRVQSSALDVHI